MNIVARTDRGRVRPVNEDCHFTDTVQGIFIVADGMGGHEAGEVASAMAVQAFTKYWQEHKLQGEPAQVLAEACREANRVIYRESINNLQWTGMGTTLTAAYLDSASIAIAHVGDSRAYLFRGGQVRLLTRDHSLVEEMVRQGKLTEAEALSHPQRNIITRALGTRDEVQVDTILESWMPRDILVLCTDGLTNLVTADEIASMLNSSRAHRPDDLGKVADQLLQLALDRGGYDNVTFLIIWQKESEGWQQ
ncbi:Stp1/IreP family PP2C-type Ser/Thr phosphatase [Heliobacillus mobilis]|uniref:Stp1/IreP family PP2C-type Ser/Thr phosphatase n=1 Tax=Heliobacterium mobile TaxID=28064 RepID=A0A6I3SBD3_HELMO|nr:Stp1/IreP family PP2C-type Ser/Thr phosphatase [Heliobacterium mobile]MTV47638.1 Stp1/IreP family PP2C-type Ser/Thr phosphatase [Heliobacterium mobile]